MVGFFVKAMEIGCLLGAVTCLILVSLANSMPLRELLEAGGRFKRQTAEGLIRKTFDFSTTCRGNIVLTLAGKPINQRDLRLSAADAAQLAPILYDQTFEDRVDVWCKVAEMTQELARSIGKQINVFDIEDLKLFQGDILLTKRSVDAAIENDPTGQGRLQRTLRPTQSNPDPSTPITSQYPRVKRKVISSLQYKWQNGIVPWRFDSSSHTESDRNVIRQAIASWEAKTCLRFPENNNPGRIPHVRFIKDNGCYSYIGKDPFGQPISIGQGCAFLGIVVHEIGHAIGLSHEQSRPDRNRYVKIDDSNVWPGFLGNFIANSWSNFHTDGIPYDYSSVMHYAALDFALSRSKDTVISLDPEMRATLGQRNDLSFFDAKIANMWYCSDGCPGFSSLEWANCENEGYRNPNQCNECICPPGFAPPYCQEVVQRSVCGNSELFAESRSKVLTSPGFNGVGHPLQTECAYQIKAPAGMRVKARFLQLEMQNNFPACRAFVEVRYKHMALAGPRFCGSNVPSQEFVSHGNTVMVTFLTKTDQTKGFQLEYSAENCGGCSANPRETEPACLETDLLDCLTEGQDNRCFEISKANKRYCCGGYSLNGDNCVDSGVPPGPVTTTTQGPVTTTTGAPATTTTTPVPLEPWSPWSQWSECSRDCGACGKQYRTRVCNIMSACGNESDFEIRPCNTQECAGVTPVGFCDEPRLTGKK